ncbi:MAG TPA: ATP-binding cassette domain-containing protein [Acholeplasmataceae bacterium]|jgi:ABC-2 type transport system ATP-binding protein|nr:ATP-binding cassette domain-containing protein [Acholeplasmataceae bacterium]
MIKINNLYKKYNDCVAVNNLSLEIYDNELFALLGVNGAGKTTTIKMLSCLLSPTSGDATVNGFSILKEQNKIKNIIGLSPQETSIARNLTVKENLMFYGEIFGLEKDALSKRVNEIIEMFKLSKYENKKAKVLSGGTKRKLSIGMALVSKPQILFLDEPTLGLDVISRHELWDIIQELKKDTTIILTTHYLEEAEHLSDRIGIMFEGNLIALGTANELKEKTKENTFEKAFIQLVKEKQI